MLSALAAVIRVVLYIRVSTDEQVREGYSIEAQKASLIAYAKKHGYKIVGIFIDEGYTARRRFDKRKEFVRMMDVVKADECDLILFIKLDRWFRSVSDYYKIQEILESSNVNWKTTLEDYDTSTASGRLNLNIRLSVNQDESDRTGERIDFVFEKKVADGEVITGSSPLGYKIRKKRLVFDPEKKDIAREVFDSYMMYHSRAAVVRDIKARIGYNISYNTVTSMLNNTMYYGSYRDNNKYCPALITKEEFDRVQELQSKNSIKAAPSGRVYIFSSLVRCKVCGRSMAGTHTLKGEKDYYYYRCVLGARNYDCSNKKRIREDSIEEYLLENISNELNQYKIEYGLKQLAPIKPVLDKRKIERKLERLKELYVNELIDLKSYKSDFEMYKSQLQDFEEEKQGSKVDFERLENILNRDFATMYKSLNKEGKKVLWLNTFEHVLVNEGKAISIFFE